MNSDSTMVTEVVLSAIGAGYAISRSVFPGGLCFQGEGRTLLEEIQLVRDLLRKHVM